MYIKEIELKNFRNYEELHLEFNENVISDSQMRVFLWSAIDSMEPLCEASPFFE